MYLLFSILRWLINNVTLMTPVPTPQWPNSFAYNIFHLPPLKNLQTFIKVIILLIYSVSIIIIWYVVFIISVKLIGALSTNYNEHSISYMLQASVATEFNFGLQPTITFEWFWILLESWDACNNDSTIMAHRYTNCYLIIIINSTHWLLYAVVMTLSFSH